MGEEVEVDSGKRGGVPTETAEKLKSLEREVRELRQANEILRKASAYFAQAEFDRFPIWLGALVTPDRCWHPSSPER